MKIAATLLFVTTALIFGGLFVYKTHHAVSNKNMDDTQSLINMLDEADLKCQVKEMDPETNTQLFHSNMHKEIRDKVMSTFAEKKGLLFVRGTEADFARQVRNFLYLTGVQYQVYGHYIVMNLETKRSVLFSPKLPNFELIWHHEKLPTRDELKVIYGVDEVYWTEQFEAKMKEWAPSKVFTLEDQKLPSNPTNAPVETTLLKNHLYSLRAIKTASELRLLRIVNKVSSRSHQIVMKNMRVGLNEFQLHSLYKFVSHNCGLRNQSYEPIVGAGRNSGILHYTTNNMEIKNGQMFLIDAGPEYHGYSSDITVTYPTNGRFTREQRVVYEAVLNTQVHAIKSIKVGMLWADLVKIAQLKMLDELKRAQFVVGDIDKMHSLKVHSLFQPHGLGHFVGLDVHDTHKLPPGPLAENMVVTIEPGCYFIPFLFEEATVEQKAHLNMSLIRQFYTFGGVRIEDDIRITNTGVEWLSNVPRTVEEVEKYMKK